MRRSKVITHEPDTELSAKIRQARRAVTDRKSRYLLCPYCSHKVVQIFDDACGHLEAKCSKCGRRTVFDLISMRRTAG
jgi:DNA-directed RNA polymerase subunit RPC12/RpoP